MKDCHAGWLVASYLGLVWRVLSYLCGDTHLWGDDKSHEEAEDTHGQEEHQGAMTTTQTAGEHVQQCGVGGGDQGKLCADAQVNEHEHEENGPQRRDG